MPPYHIMSLANIKGCDLSSNYFVDHCQSCSNNFIHILSTVFYYLILINETYLYNNLTHGGRKYPPTLNSTFKMDFSKELSWKWHLPVVAYRQLRRAAHWDFFPFPVS